MRRLLLTLALIVTTASAGVGPAGAATPVQVDVKPNGKLVQGGAFASVRVDVACPDFGHVLEAFLFIQQGGVSGQGGIGGLVCDGRERKYDVRVEGTEPFHRGAATFSGFVLLCDDAGECIQGQETTAGKLTGK